MSGNIVKFAKRRSGKADLMGVPAADPGAGYVDDFTGGVPLPVVGPNGTDVRWPDGWTEPEALFWRAWRGILRPGDKAPAVCPRCHGEQWVCENHPREAYTVKHKDGEGMPCPVSSAWAYPSDNDGEQRPQPIGPTWRSPKTKKGPASDC